MNIEYELSVYANTPDDDIIDQIIQIQEKFNNAGIGVSLTVKKHLTKKHKPLLSDYESKSNDDNPPDRFNA